MTDVEKLVDTHLPLLDRARHAIKERTYWSAFAESPSPRIWGEEAPAAGKAAFEASLGKPFPLATPGARGTIAPERSPYGLALDIGYPHLRADAVDELLAAAQSGMAAWRTAGHAQRAAVCIEILQRLNQRSFELAHAVMHTTGQGFVMAFQAGCAHAFDRALEALAYSYEAMSSVPHLVEWEKPRGRGEPQRLTKVFTIVPRGVSLVVGCVTFPTWNSYPGFFASLATGNPVVVKPHPHAVLPLALTVATARDTLEEFGFDPNLVTLAVEADGEQLASTLATHPAVRIIDFTGSTAYGEWLETNARQAVVFTEKAGVNCVVVDSTGDLDGTVANLAQSLALYSGQMCTTPQTILIPRGGIQTDRGPVSVDDVIGALGKALDDLLSEPARAAALLGAIVDDRVVQRMEAAAGRASTVIASRVVHNGESAGAQMRTPLVLRVDADREEIYGTECFGPVAFVVETHDTAHSLAIWRTLTQHHGAITGSVYSTSDDVLAAAEEIALDTGISISTNLTSDVLVNQSAAFSDFHATGANPAANASLTDLAFVVPRFRVVESRRPA